MKKFSCTLCMSGSKSLIFSIGNVLLGIKKHSPHLFDRIVIYTEVLPDNDKNALKSIFEYVEIVEYFPKFNTYLSEIYSDSTNKGARMPCFVYADFEIFNLIKDSKKVVYLDSDILIKGDISNILNYVDEQNCIAMRKIASKLDVAVGTIDPNLSKSPFYNSGVIVINEHEKFSNFANECYKIAAEYAKTKPQDILDHLNYLMDREFEYTVDLPFAAKDIKRITDFEGTLHELTTNVIHSVNTEFMRRSEVAGVSQEYILDYITRGCTIRLMKFMFDHNAGYESGTGDEDTEE